MSPVRPKLSLRGAMDLSWWLALQVVWYWERVLGSQQSKGKLMVTATATSKPPPVPCCSTCTPLCPSLYMLYAYTLGATTINGNLQVNGMSIATNCCCITDASLG